MLEGDFYTITNLEATSSEIKAVLEINADHKIFTGHFPNQPVVPGVCMMQMVKEILEEVKESKFNLVKAHYMKFLAIIDPVQNNIIAAVLKYNQEEDGNFTVSATLFKDELIHFKFKGLFCFQEQPA